LPPVVRLIAVAAVALSLAGCAALGLPFGEADTVGVSDETTGSIATQATAADQVDPSDWEAVRRAVASVSLEDGLVLDCDLRVRERLRFLIWTRRVRSENRASTADPVAPAGAHLDFELAPRTTSEPGPDTQLS
jgi:hypothetical protein